MSDVTVVNNTDESRFEATIAGEVVGIIDYATSPGVMDMQHTEVFPGHEGEGIASTLVRAALETLQQEDPPVQLIATCPFVKAYVDRHPEFQALRDPR